MSEELEREAEKYVKRFGYCSETMPELAKAHWLAGASFVANRHEVDEDVEVLREQFASTIEIAATWLKFHGRSSPQLRACIANLNGQAQRIRAAQPSAKVAP